MKTVDFHCHTKATKKHESELRTVTPELFAEMLDRAGVEIAAITNHNAFDLPQFQNLVSVTHDFAQIWPGVELDVQREGEHWHMLVICDPDKVEEFDSTLSSIVGDLKADEVLLDFETVWNAFLPLDALFISHVHKEPAISEKQIQETLSLAGNQRWRLFFEPTNLLSVGIMSNHGFNMIIGSDIQDWNEYPEKYCKEKRCTLRLDIDGFKQYCLLAQRNEVVVDTLLNSRALTPMPVAPHKTVSFTLPIYQDINVIFGQKGTGKTEIIKSLYEEYNQRGIQSSTYFGGQKISDFDNLLSTAPMKRDPELFGRSNCEAEIESILNWSDEIPTPIEKYKLWITTKGNSKKKSQFKLSECQELPEISTAEYENTKQDIQIVKQFKAEYDARSIGSYLIEEDEKELYKLLTKLMVNISNRRKGLFIDIESTLMTNKALNQIKNLIDKKSDTVSKPSKCGLFSYIAKRITLLTLVEQVLENLSEKTYDVPEYLGKLEDKGTLLLVSRWSYLNKASLAKEFASSGAKISDLKKWKRSLENIREKVFSEELPEAIEEFANIAQDTGINSLDKFIGTSKFIQIEGSEDQYNPSDGEKGILLLERKLNADAEVFLLDEPENGMSNLYIDSIVRPIIVDLARSRKTVIIATHNANIAVRTLPYQSVYREHVEGNEYRTYIGNPFINRLIDLDGRADDIGWAECSMRTLEGGSEAFYSRMTIYEAGE